MRQRTLQFAVGLMVLSAGTELSAQVFKPGLSLTPAFDAPRSHAPIQLNALLTWNSVEILEGRLQLEFYVNQQRVHTWVSREVVLSVSELTLPVMVPPVLLASPGDLLSVRARFLAEKQTYDLDIHDVPYPVDFRRGLTIGIVHPETAGWPPSDFTTPFRDRLAWVEPFRLDAALPHKDWSRHLNCRTIPVEPELFPDVPLELTAFDLLIVTGEGFADLGEDQLEALAGWVEAGGALCLAGERAPSPDHRSFLNRVAGSSPVDPILEFDGDGNVRFRTGSETEWLRAAPGVGRAIVTFEPVDVRASDWKRDVLDLWRVRPRQIDTILATGNWEFAVDYDYLLLDPDFQPLRPASQADISVLQSHLMPERVEGVPLPTVTILLAACLLAVGPGDYLLLGWLNRRRWTWILFPAVAIAFSIFMVQLATSHMGRSDHRTTLSIVDLTRDGRPARISRFELLFAASEKQVEEELSQTLVVPLDSRREYVEPRSGQYRPGSTPAGPPGVMVGRMPRSYTHIRSLRQWTPRLARYTTMGPRDETIVPEFDWWRLKADTLRDVVQRSDILNELQAALPDAQIVLLRQQDSWRPDEVPNVGETGGDGRDVSQLPVQFAVGISARASDGMFHIVSQISPNAAGNFEDLTLFDRDDPRQWLLLIVTADDDGNQYIYRRLIRDNSA